MDIRLQFIWNISLSTTISQNGIFEFRNLTFFRNTDIGTWNIQTGFPLIFTIKGHILGYNTPYSYLSKKVKYQCTISYDLLYHLYVFSYVSARRDLCLKYIYLYNIPNFSFKKLKLAQTLVKDHYLFWKENWQNFTLQS